MKHYHKNPRRITKKQFENLRQWLRELGDLSGVVHNLPTDEIIGGNQRMEVFDLNNCQIEITERLDVPDEQGTVARGFVVWGGKKYTYRAVQWTPEQCEQANIVANKSGGTWDMDILANQFEFGDLMNWGFDEYDLDIGEVVGGTSTNRDGQGVSSTWESVSQTDNERVVIGDIETRLSGETAGRVREYLKTAYDKNGTPINESLEKILNAGLESVMDNEYSGN